MVVVDIVLCLLLMLLFHGLSEANVLHLEIQRWPMHAHLTPVVIK